MNDLKYKYFIFKGINDLEYLAIDRERKVICTIRDGLYSNQTKGCEKIYEKDKEKSWDKRRVGCNWIKCLLTGYKDGILHELVLQTNKQKEFDLECISIRKEQTKFRLKCIESDFNKLLKEEQYYTYAFSNLDYVIGEDKLNDKYFQNVNGIENTLDEIIKPKPYEGKEVEVTILDEEYDLETTFYYIEEPKDNYEKFMKYLSENIIVKEIWKDRDTLIVGMGEFIKNHKEQFSNLFGKQIEEDYIENIIKMIDGNATESCYEDFLKEFKIDFKFMFCNNHTFEEIKETPIDDLKYEEAHNLAFIENRETHVSAYLGVYDNEFQLTYSVHSQNDFDNNYENILVEPINMNNIKSKEQLKETMKSMLNNFYNSRSELIEESSRKLDEKNTEEQEETEELEE